MDWDKLRVFHAAAAAGSFTHAGEALGLSQSAVSRQVSALEGELRVPLFHRHARGLILTEHGETLFGATRDVLLKLETVKQSLSDSREKPNGELRVTTTIGLGVAWLASRLKDFSERYPEISITLLLTDEELDLSMREADVGIRLRQPTQPDLIQRKLFTVHFHVYGSSDYIAQHGAPTDIAELDHHRLLSYGGSLMNYLRPLNLLLQAGRTNGDLRRPILTVNNITALKNATESGMGLAILPDYLIDDKTNLVPLMPGTTMPAFDTYFVYAEELRNLARVQVFRDFLVAKAQGWQY
ncbi:LysR family transcriptional regulator [Candidatus Raskinella chloraquaticus]